ncbi:MAG: class III extradiol ring-cleavage dioxygenase [Propionivibrio sp.]
MNATDPLLPTLFVPHGAPTFALRPGAAGAALTAFAAALPPPRPRAIVVISAHWETAEPTVGFAERPQTIHDFGGFPQALYEIRYPATGCREASQEVLQALLDAGFDASADADRGLDHGAWLPLRQMFPDADIPVLPLSIQPRLGPAHHYRIGHALAPLARRGFLILASGNLTHNLTDYQRVATRNGGAESYVRDFADWIWEKLVNKDLPALLDYRRQAPDAVRAHPRDEHLLPLFVALGAAGEKPATQRLHAGIDDFVLAMDAFAFNPAQ